MPEGLLELYKGTGSAGRAFEALGWEVISVDIDPRANATYCCDIMNFDYEAIGPVDVIWGSPPCCRYSIARTKSKDNDLESSDNLVKKTLEIIDGVRQSTKFP